MTGTLFWPCSLAPGAALGAGIGIAVHLTALAIAFSARCEPALDVAMWFSWFVRIFGAMGLLPEPGFNIAAGLALHAYALLQYSLVGSLVGAGIQSLDVEGRSA